MFVALPSFPSAPGPLVLQFAQCAPGSAPAFPLLSEWVQTRSLDPNPPPVSVTVIGASSGPSVRSVKVAAIVVPVTSRYGPVEGTKRELGELVLSESHAL